ncbi:hypothetical protein CONLIGDRAFT_631917 [Coniochaeta ligniaria NRRL 30616]|uniref:Uncharacterized protein n=1 Tax=Coniochaeta ligniaria NRRL 30616 TaxID=1408157 RepID=A0A1J7J987_9PEZI|nr:hypothetical protein CONLIGDRAFT_631917 [Coniochaeta ligniaria NRRL 30616]
MATRKVRYKKLNVKTPLPVLREDQLDSTEYEAITAETHIATGVEQAEENVSYSFTSLGLAYHVQSHVTRGSTPWCDNHLSHVALVLTLSCVGIPFAGCIAECRC